MMKNKSAGTYIGTIGIIYIGFSLLLGLVLDDFTISIGSFAFREMVYSILLFLSYFLTFVPVCIIALLFIRLHKTSRAVTESALSLSLPSEKVGFGNFIVGVFSCYGFAVIGNIAGTIIFRLMERMGLPDISTEFYLPETKYPMWLFIITIVALPPLFEELLCRGSLYYYCSDFGGLAFGLVSGITFALFHANFAQMPTALMFGFSAAFFTYHYKNIWISITAHLINNGVAVLVTYINNNSFYANQLNLLISLLLMIISIFSIVVFFSTQNAARSFKMSFKQFWLLIKLLFNPIYIAFAISSIYIAARDLI